jgi:S-sulfo-L-cysteine synthase (3-phospho-L-serine-dependent)
MLALRTAAELGLRPVFLTSNPDRYAGLSDAGPEVVCCDTDSMAAIVRTVGRWERADIVGVTSTSDFYLAAVAELASALGLPGSSAEAIRACRDKAVSRSRLLAAQVGQPRFAVALDLDAAVAGVGVVGLPCVVKPVDDSGSHGVRVCRTMDEVREHCAGLLRRRLNVRGQPAAAAALIEEYLDGPEYSLEMFSWNGHAECVGITEKSLAGFPHCVESRHIFPACVGATEESAMLATVRTALTALGISQGPTHTELKMSAGGPAIIEVNPRLAGGMIPELIQIVTGIDLLEQQIRAAMGRAPELIAVGRGYAGIQFLAASERGVLREVTGADEGRRVPGVVRVTVTGKPGAAVSPPRSAYDRLGYIIARGASRDAVARSLTEASERIRIRLSVPETTPA